MDKSEITINDENINTEELVKKIRDKIQLKMHNGTLYTKQKQLFNELSQFNNKSDPFTNKSLSMLNNNYTLSHSNFIISSHHQFFGKLLVKIRTLILGEIKQYSDPLFSKQTLFNSGVRQFILDLVTRINFIEERLEKINESTNEVRNLNNKQIKEQINSVFHAIDQDINLKVDLSNILQTTIQEKISYFDNSVHESNQSDGHCEYNYLDFENRFRGNREEILNRQKAFINYYNHCSNVLDIGCGRGEFLELLQKNGISCIGVDVNTAMIDYCKRNNFNVEENDAIRYLESKPDESFEGIFIDQVVEHLKPEYLIKLLSLCSKKLKPGYYLIIETINPGSFFSLSNFFIDITHIKPIHPETLKYLLEISNFSIESLYYSSPVLEENRLESITIRDEYNLMDYFVLPYNRNIEKLNHILFGYQDYAIIAKRE